VQLAWGEYWRRAGKPAAALEHFHRALSLQERLDDTRNLLSMRNNLCALCMELHDYAEAEEHALQVVAAGAAGGVDAYLLASALGNLGAVHFFQERHEDAIARYAESLALSERFGLTVIADRAHFNLAEAYFTLFARSGDVRHEALGDRHAALAKAAGAQARDGRHVPGLKAGVLASAAKRLDYDSLRPAEFVEHADEMAAIEALRARLALAGGPADRVADRLAIAEIYRAIFEKERRAAADLAARASLEAEFAARLEALQNAPRAEAAPAADAALLAHWRQRAHGLMTPERIHAVLQQLARAGAINKSAYAQLCGVGLATASKHLGELVRRGLVVQVGKSRSTRYVLP
jgi:hypothetical protein